MQPFYGGGQPPYQVQSGPQQSGVISTSGQAPHAPGYGGQGRPHGPYGYAPVQAWNQAAPPPPPPVPPRPHQQQSGPAAYNPNVYGPMPGGQQPISPIQPTGPAFMPHDSNSGIHPPSHNFQQGSSPQPAHNSPPIPPPYQPVNSQNPPPWTYTSQIPSQQHQQPSGSNPYSKVRVRRQLYNSASPLPQSQATGKSHFPKKFRYASPATYPSIPTNTSGYGGLSHSQQQSHAMSTQIGKPPAGSQWGQNLPFQPQQQASPWQYDGSSHSEPEQQGQWHGSYGRPNVPPRSHTTTSPPLPQPYSYAPQAGAANWESQSGQCHSNSPAQTYGPGQDEPPRASEPSLPHTTSYDQQSILSQPVSPLLGRAESIPTKMVRSSTVSSASTTKSQINTTAPVTATDTQIGASALSSGGPSDWEYFVPALGDNGDDPFMSAHAPQESRPAVPESPAAVELPSEVPFGNRNSDVIWQNEAAVHELPAEPSQVAVTQPQQEASDPTGEFVVDDGGARLTATASEALSSTDEVTGNPSHLSSKTAEFISDESSWVDRSQDALERSHETVKGVSQNFVPQPRDLIPDLDPWYAGSLERYIAMLRTEAAASPVEEKAKAFITFVAAESQIRGIPYHRDPPRDGAPEYSAAGVQPRESSESGATAHIGEGMLSHRPKIIPLTIPADLVEVLEGEYSPGGRPILSRRVVGAANRGGPEYLLGEKTREDRLEAGKSSTAPSRTAAAVPADNDASATASFPPYGHNTMAAGSETASQPPILTPTSSEDDGATVIPLPTDAGQKSLYRSYIPGEQVIDTAIEGTLPHRSSIPSPTSVNSRTSERERSETFFPAPLAPRSKPAKAAPPHPSKSPSPPPLPYPTATPSPPPYPTTRSPSPATNPTSAMARLASLLPATTSPTAPTPSHPFLTHIQQTLSALPSPTPFINSLHTTFSATESDTRTSLDAARRDRQDAAERHNDELFEWNEITYAELGAREKALRAEEAEKVRAEERELYEGYVGQVFGKVYERLQEDVGVGIGLVGEVERMVADSVGGMEGEGEGRGAVVVGGGGTTNDIPPPLSACASALLSLHNFLSSRHALIADAVAERDARYKRTELAPLAAAGQPLEALERHFSDAEKAARARVAEEHERRTRRVWERVEEWMEMGRKGAARKMGRIREAAEGGGRGGGGGGGGMGMAAEGEAVDLLRRRAVAAVAALAAESTLLIQVFHTVERALNDAEYEASIAKAKAVGADETMLGRLAEENEEEKKVLGEELAEQLRNVEGEREMVVEAVERVMGGGGREGPGLTR